MKYYCLLLLAAFFTTLLNAQHESNWHLRDVQQDGVCGTSVYKAHKDLLNNKKPQKKIIVAVLDSGVDINHEDFEGRIWTNEKEIADNGIDDDRNGYIDDVNGWNFLGNANGDMVIDDNLEFVRMIAAFEKKSSLTSEEKALYKKLKKEHEEAYNGSKQELEAIGQINEIYPKVITALSYHLNKQEFTREEVEAISSSDEGVSMAKRIWLDLNEGGLTPEMLEEANEYHLERVKYHLNKDLNTREIIGDDYSNQREIGYGNNKVGGEFADHGTHVAGIIGAIRGNNLGADGQADHVLIMPVRVVPNGDEHDKDVANGIRYATDNGANIINMSFGKGYSPYPEIVAEAIEYAGNRGVLLVHGSGNDGKNNDIEVSYPQDAKPGEPSLPYWIEVGASDEKVGRQMLASFSNYGKSTVDIFAPGVQIDSTVPDSKYEKNDGTSMASPVVAGVAALVWSYYPELSNTQLKAILMSSALDLRKTKVIIPGSLKKTKFKKLCSSAGIVNAYAALALAQKTLANRK